ncbi:DUF1656 domain-containing protein [Photobacterium sp. Ph5]|nr:DUF1656 domain-containing protein [Photobacterium sp. Ph6]MCG3876211.1 DUF1656 domain-containing protein [Photobacterium sp. Ph5]
MYLANDFIFLNILIPKMIIIGFISVMIFFVIKKVIEKTNLLNELWHPRLMLWSLLCSLYALIVIFSSK